MPAAILTDDDPCLDGLGPDGQSCGTGLLQQRSGLQRLSPTRRSEKATGAEAEVLSFNTNAAGLRPAAAGAEAATPMNVSLQNVSLVAERRTSKQEGATSLLADMRQLVTKVKLSGDSAAQVRHVAEEYSQILETQAVPSITSGYKEHQQLLQTHARSYARCDADLRTRLETGAQLQEAHRKWSSMLQDCRGHETRLQHELTQCNKHLEDKRQKKQGACSILNATDVGGAGHNDSSLIVLKKNCQDSTRAYVDQWSICEEGERFAETKRSECDSVQQSMHTTNCARASQVSGVCDMYDLCRAGMSMAYTSAKEAARAWERYHKAEWLAVVTVRCFADTIGTEENRMMLLEQLERCEQLVANTTLLDLQYEDVPAPMPCTPVTDSPCLEHQAHGAASAAPGSAGQARSKALSVAASEAAEDLQTEAVSFVQENLVRATVILPHEVNEAIFGPLAMPVALALVSITGLVLIVRCMISGEGKSPEKKAKAADEDRSLAIDTWCTNSVSAEGGSAGLQLTVDGCGRLLCPELLVPSKSQCVIAVPQLLALRPDAGAKTFMVADKVGQPLFKARFSSTAGAADAARSEQVILTRQDGTRLALCQLTLPQGAGGRKQAECIIQGRQGQLFANLRRDIRQASWLSRTLKRAPAEPVGGNGLFIFDTCGPTGACKSPKGGAAWQVRVQGSATEQKLLILDGAGRSMAMASRGASVGFDTGGRDFYRVEVGGALDTDLGLVTMTLLAVDRLLSAYAD